MTKPEIAPCPFCGVAVRFVQELVDEVDQKPVDEAELWFARCPACKQECGGFHSRDEVIAFWNTYAECVKQELADIAKQVREILGFNPEPLNEEPKEG